MITKLIGVRISQLRHERGETQESLAARIGMARSYFAEIEIGKRNTSVRNLLAISNALGVTLKEFFSSDLFDSLYDDENIIRPAARSSDARKPNDPSR